MAKNVLGFQQLRDVAAWLESKDAGRLTATEAASMLSRELGFVVTAANVRHIAQQIGITLRSGRKAARKPRKLKDTHTGLSVLAKCWLELLPQLQNVELPADLLRDLERLAAKKMREDGSCPTLPARNQKTLALQTEAEYVGGCEADVDPDLDSPGAGMSVMS